MRLYLEITEGPSKGQKITINGKTSLGRKGADVLLNDAKLSGIHVLFDYIEGVGWVIKDQNSRNGVWINGLKEQRHVISDLDEIMIGTSKMTCRILDTSQIKFTDRFKHWIQGLFKRTENRSNRFKVIKPEIRLRVIQGIQYGQTWEVFYGPRTAGRDSPDICLFEENVPRVAFEIKVKGKYAYFFTRNEKVVKINKRSVKEKQFTPGDVISIGESEILVEVNEGNGFSS